jgi:glycosyltransferase involved in cell wall biosynthesis
VERLKRIGFLMEQTLGSITHYRNLRHQEARAHGFTPTWLPIDYAETTLPWALEGSLVARRSLAKALPAIDGALIHTNTLALLVGDLTAQIPTVLSTDGTAANKHAMREHYNLKPESTLGALAKRSVYRFAFRRAQGFVAWCNWAKQSLVDDYQCRPEDIAVIPPGVDCELFKPGARAAGDRLPRVLFVGGDFARKDGELLLEVFRKRFRGKAELHLVTRSPITPEPGVHVHRAVEPNSAEIAALYASCDVFTLPTRGDCLPIAGIEAVAAGLPVVLSEVGGLPDLVRDGVNGHLIQMDDGPALGDALEHILGDETLRASMGAASRAHALATFDVRLTSEQLFDFVGARCGVAARARAKT